MTKVIWLRFDKMIFELNIIYFTLFMELRAKKNVIVSEQKFKNFDGTLFMCIIVSLNVSSGIKVLQEWKEKKKPSKKREKQFSFWLDLMMLFADAWKHTKIANHSRVLFAKFNGTNTNQPLNIVHFLLHSCASY